MRVPLVVTLLLCALSASAATPARAERADEVRWQPEWARVRPLQYGVAGALIATELYFELGPVRAASEPRVRGPWLFDDPVRDAITVEDAQTQLELDRLSDFIWHPTQWFPIYADVLGASLLAHGSGETAWQLLAISGQALLGVAVLTRTMHLLVRRQRPVFYEAERRGETIDVGSAETLSFPSGHSATAFAAAGLTCSFHRHLPLFGGGFWDDAACPTLLTAATTVAALRMISDRHYATDTLLGSGLGFTIGWFLPELLHFRARGPREVSFELLPVAGPRHTGLWLHASF